MANNVINWALTVPLSICSAKFVLVVLANFADKQGRCWPSVATLARCTSMGERTVYRHLNALERYGYIAREVTAGKVTHYQLNPDPCQTGRGQTDETPADLAGDPCQIDTPPLPDWQGTPARLADEPIRTINEPPPTQGGSCPLPPEWEPDADQIEWAIDNYPTVDVRHEIDKFRDHYLGNGKARCNWVHVFRNWIRKAATEFAERPTIINRTAQLAAENQRRASAALARAQPTTDDPRPGRAPLRLVDGSDGRPRSDAW